MKDDILTKDRLTKRQEELDAKNENDSLTKRNFKKWIAITIAVIIFLTVVIMVFDKIIITVQHNNFMAEADDYSIEQLSRNSDLFEYADVYEIFENKALGNLNNNLINYGYYASNGELTVYIESEKGTAILQNANDSKQITDYPVRYINIADNAIYFRKDSDRKIYTCDLKGENVTKVFDIKVGQFVASDNHIYYINFDEGGKLYSYDINSKNSEQICNDSVTSFIKLGNEFIYLDSGSNLKKCNEKGGNSIIQSNIEKFYYNGNIVVQNNGNIITFTLGGKNPKQVIDGGVELIGADKDNIYYSKNREIYKYDNNSGNSTKLAEGCDFYKAVYKTEKGFYIVGCVKNNENNTYSDKILRIDRE